MHGQYQRPHEQEPASPNLQALFKVLLVEHHSHPTGSQPVTWPTPRRRGWTLPHYMAEGLGTRRRGELGPFLSPTSLATRKSYLSAKLPSALLTRNNDASDPY